MKKINKPKSLLMCEYVSLKKSGDHIGALEKLDEIVDLANSIFTLEELRIFMLSQALYGRRNDQADGWVNLKDKILTNQKLHVVFINDVGFNAGAGIAMSRQAQSFLKFGNDISLICGREDSGVNRMGADRYSGVVRNVICIKNILSDSDLSRGEKSRSIVDCVVSVKPDFVITGNFHACGVPSEVFMLLNNESVPLFVYAHDCDWITGGCAHYLYHNCNNYLSGCDDDNCPKNAKDYPPLLDATISKNWSERSRIFSDICVQLVANSRWNYRQHRNRFGFKANISLVHLGIDIDVFKPMDKIRCKEKLGIPSSSLFVVAGSGFLRARGKGGLELKSVFEHYVDRSDVTVGYFGGSSSGDLPKNVLSFGYIRDDVEMATIFSAADVFVNPVTIEAFGQTMLEAAACGCPIVSYGACGSVDIAVPNLTALEASHSELSDLLRCVDQLLGDHELRRRLGSNGIVLARHFFSLTRQAANWRTLLLDASLKRQWSNPGMRLKPIRSVSQGDGWLLPNRKQMVGLLQGSKPLISVITVVYNCGQEFHRTAQTILSQSYVNLEWIVIDGGSESPVTHSILDFYRNVIDVFVSEPDNGIYDAMAKGADKANGYWSIFLGSGDYFAGDNAVEIAVENANINYDMIIGNVIEERIDGSLSITQVQSVHDKINALYRDCYDGPWMRGLPPHQGTFMKTELIRRLGFDKEFKISADWDIIFRAAILPGSKVLTIDHVVAYYPNGGYSANNSVAWVKEVKRIAEKYCTDKRKLDDYFNKIISHHAKVTSVRQEENLVIQKYLDFIRRRCGFE